jgi:REP element-mobilizing transposase RayT
VQCLIAAEITVTVPSADSSPLAFRGNGRARTFFDEPDYALNRDLLAEHCRAAEVEVWVWCLMPNHVHLILVASKVGGG